MRRLFSYGLVLSFSGLTALAQQSAGEPVKTVFDLFPMDAVCVCIKTKAESATVTSSEMKIGRKIFQVFRDKAKKREIFRVAVGSSDAKWWNYGVVAEGDFNGDGVQDYSWYGGDDTSDVMHVFLSFGGGHYRRLDVYKTIEREWERPFRPGPRLRLGQAGPEEGSLKRVGLVRTSRELVLETVVAQVVPDPVRGMKSTDSPLHIAESRFVFSK